MKEESLLRRIDWVTTIVPFVGMAALCALFILIPDGSKAVLESIRHFIGDDCASITPFWA